MTTLLIADDQALVRVGLRKILVVEPDLEVVAEASDGHQAVRVAAAGVRAAERWTSPPPWRSAKTASTPMWRHSTATR